jgi:hypothetical protein
MNVVNRSLNVEHFLQQIKSISIKPGSLNYSTQGLKYRLFTLDSYFGSLPLPQLQPMGEKNRKKEIHFVMTAWDMDLG